MRRRVQARARPSSAAIPARRVLVVEDEFHMAQYFDEILRRMGIQVIGPVGTLRQAMILAETERVDAALLDVRLQPDVRLPYSDRVYPVAELLCRRNIPFCFVTAYADDWIGRFPTNPVLRKPFHEDQLKNAVRKLLRRESTGPSARAQRLGRAERKVLLIVQGGAKRGRRRPVGPADGNFAE